MPPNTASTKPDAAAEAPRKPRKGEEGLLNMARSRWLHFGTLHVSHCNIRQNALIFNPLPSKKPNAKPDGAALRRMRPRDCEAAGQGSIKHVRKPHHVAFGSIVLKKSFVMIGESLIPS
jgi:hypothetical protein